MGHAIAANSQELVRLLGTETLLSYQYRLSITDWVGWVFLEEHWQLIILRNFLNILATQRQILEINVALIYLRRSILLCYFYFQNCDVGRIYSRPGHIHPCGEAEQYESSDRKTKNCAIYTERGFATSLTVIERFTKSIKMCRENHRKSSHFQMPK